MGDKRAVGSCNAGLEGSLLAHSSAEVHDTQPAGIALFKLINDMAGPIIASVVYNDDFVLVGHPCQLPLRFADAGVNIRRIVMCRHNERQMDMAHTSLHGCVVQLIDDCSIASDGCILQLQRNPIRSTLDSHGA